MLGFDTFSIRVLFRRSQYRPTVLTGLLLLDNDLAPTNVHRLESWLIPPRYGRDEPIFIRFVEGVLTGVRCDSIPRITTHLCRRQSSHQNNGAFLQDVEPLSGCFCAYSIIFGTHYISLRSSYSGGR
jgi:hypothetical protein